MKEIAATIDRIAAIAATIAAAVAEQGTATHDISQNAVRAAEGTARIVSDIGEANRGAGKTGSASARVLASARSLASESNHLKVEVDRFLATVRAA
jgi:methyl-accepting chemotaxis protein